MKIEKEDEAHLKKVRQFHHDGITGWARFFILLGLALFFALFIKAFGIKEPDTIGFAVIALLGILIETTGIMMLRWSRAGCRMERELKENGQKVVATINDCVYTGVHVGGSGHGHDGTALHWLLCSCAIDNRLYHFKSNSLHGNPMRYLPDNRVIVYCDKHDTGRYFVDVDESIAEFYDPADETEESVPIKWKLPLLLTVLVVVVRQLVGSPISSIGDIFPLPFFFIFIAWLCNARWELKENRHPFFLHLLLAVGTAVASFVFPSVWRESTAYFTAVSLAFVTLPVTFIVSFCSQEARKRRRCSVRTTAVVIGHRQETIQSTGTFLPIFAYDTAGGPKEVVYRTGLVRPLKEKETVEILYNEKNPEEFCFLDKGQEPSNRTAWTMVWITAFVVCTVLLVMMTT